MNEVIWVKKFEKWQTNLEKIEREQKSIRRIIWEIVKKNAQKRRIQKREISTKNGCETSSIIGNEEKQTKIYK